MKNRSNGSVKIAGEADIDIKKRLESRLFIVDNRSTVQFCNAARAAASRAIGTRNGLQET
jgi:hypothetical protein